MAFPSKLDDMVPFGYTFSDHGICRGCGEDIEWWKTPNNKPIPMNPMKSGSDSATAHWATCPEAESFRKK